MSDDPRAVPWGGDRLPLELPAAWPEPVAAWPDLSDPLADYPAALEAALAGGPPLAEGLGPSSRVAFVVDDPSRWTPVREALPILVHKFLSAGISPQNVSISVAVGRHAPLDADSMRKRVGDEAFSTYKTYSPPVDDLSAYVDLGPTADGVPVRVFRPVAEADARVLVGSVLPHLQAGFGGGYKLVFPGTSHRSTLGALHARGLGGDAARLLGGDVAANPMRAAIHDAAARLPGRSVSVSHLLGVPPAVLRVEVGDVDRVQLALADEARRRFRVPTGPPADVVIAGNDPWPGDPMMSFKALLNHRAAGRPGGVLVGVFWTDPAEIDRSFPLAALRAIAATGAVGGFVARRGLRLADRAVSALGLPSRFMVRWARELVVDRTVLVYAPALRDRLGPRLGPIRIFGEFPPLWRAAERALGGRVPAGVRVFPRGGLTYCPAG